MTEKFSSTSHPDLLDPEALSAYLLHNAREIRALMCALAERRVLITAYVDGGPISFVTAVIAVSGDADNTIMLDASADEAINARAVAASHLVCSTRLSGVRLQFEVPAPARGTHEACPVLLATIPESVLRLQRREFFRLSVPLANPVSCVLTVQDDNTPLRSIEVRVLDISNGGVAVIVPPDDIPFTPGASFPNCTLSIPDGGSATVTLRVCSVYHATTPDGRRRLRAGCEFTDLPARFAAQVQRYIFRMERERRALGSET